MITTTGHPPAITTMIVSGVRSLHRSHHTQRAISAGQSAKTLFMCRQLPPRSSGV